MELDDLDIPVDLLEWDDLRTDSGGLGRWLLGGPADALDPKQPLQQQQQQQQQQPGWQQQQQQQWQASVPMGAVGPPAPSAAGGSPQKAGTAPPTAVQPPTSGFMGAALMPHASTAAAAQVCLPAQQLAQQACSGAPPGPISPLGAPMDASCSGLSPHHLAQLQHMFNPSLLLSAVAPAAAGGAAAAAAGVGGHAAAGGSSSLAPPLMHSQSPGGAMDIYARQHQHQQPQQQPQVIMDMLLQQQKQQQQHPGSILDMLAQQTQQQQLPAGPDMGMFAQQQQQQALWAHANGQCTSPAMVSPVAQHPIMAAGLAPCSMPGMLPLQLASAGSTSGVSMASPGQPCLGPDLRQVGMGPPALPAWATAAAGGPAVLKLESAQGSKAPRARRNSNSASTTSRPPPRPSLSTGQLGVVAKGSEAAGPMQLTVGAEELADTVPGWNSMTVMQKYHYRRKVNLQRIEQTLADKLAELQVLEEENEQLKQRAAILEVMVADVDKQLGLMSDSDTHGAEQWLALLTAGNAGSPGRYQAQQGRERPLQVLFEEAAKVDMTGWTVDLLKDKWRLYVAQLRSLLEQVDAARAHHVQEPSCAKARGEQCATSRGASKQPQQQQSSWAVMAPGEGLASDTSSSGGARQLGDKVPALRVGSGTETGPALSGDSHTSACSRESSMHEQLGVVDGFTVWGGPGTDGIPLNLLAAVEGLVMTNYTWLVAMMTRSNLLTYEFLSADYEGGGRLAPAAGDPFWQRVVQCLGLSPAQLMEGSTCHKLGLRCREAVHSERARLQQVLQRQPADSVDLLPEMERMHGQQEAAAAMQRNVRREAVLRNMVGIHSINLLTLLQHARMAVASYPWFCSAWSIYAAIEQIHDQQHQQQQHLEQAGGSRKRVGSKATSK